MSLERPNPTGLPATTYAQVVVGRGSRLVFVSGQVSVDERGGVVAPGDFAGQVRQAHANLVAALSAAGATVGDVAKLTTFVVPSNVVPLVLSCTFFRSGSTSRRARNRATLGCE